MTRSLVVATCLRWVPRRSRARRARAALGGLLVSVATFGATGCGAGTSTSAAGEGTTPASRAMGPAELLREVAVAGAPIGDLLDAATGVVYVQAGLTGEDDRPRTFAAARLCGSELDAPLGELAMHLKRTVEAGDVALVCDETRCVERAAMEFDWERTFVFAPDASGRLRLVAVALIDPQVPEPVLAAYRSWASTAEQSLASAPCGRAYFAAPP